MPERTEDATVLLNHSDALVAAGWQVCRLFIGLLAFGATLWLVS